MKLLVAIVLALSAAHAMALPSVREITDLETGTLAHHKDLVQLSKFSRGSDQDGAGRLMKLSEQSLEIVQHVSEVIYILSLVTNDADKKAILSYIEQKMLFTAKDIDLLGKEVNLEVSTVQGAALVSAADKLKIDLRTLQTMIAAPR